MNGRLEMSNEPDLCTNCGKDADLCAYPMRNGDEKYVCPECWGELEAEAEANFERWQESKEESHD
jgi:predicted amidophosphoribosyltransferase